MKVFISYRIPEAGLKKLRGKFDLSVNEEERLLSKEELLDRIADADALLCVGNRIDRDVMNAGKKLKIIANYGVGYNNIDVDCATEKGIMVTNTPDVLTETTADLTWVLLMAIARRIAEADRFTRAGKFSKFDPYLLLGSDIYGQTLGIVGLGRIGQAVARRASGFDMKVLYYDVQPAAQEIETRYKAKYVDLDTLLKQSDFVTLHVPLIDSTHHLMDKDRLSLMKRTAFLINASRGAVVDEEALVKVLKEGGIAGAGLDVYEKEPQLSPGLTELDNVVLIPHLGSATLQTREAMAELAAENVVAGLAGETPPNLVNRDVLKP
ncbi:MAG: D-glycerate dehydrogenase [Dehalococcoidia bacterium]|nr:D-glycerate dehydrogenase [Dehalococcoidia bacterium]